MSESGTQEQILDAAFEAMTTFGLARLSLADVAKRANLSRQTLYRYFRTKTDLLDAVVSREEERFLARITAAASAEEDPRAAVRALLVVTLDEIRGHPLIHRLLETEPEALVPYLTQGGLPGPRAVETIAALLRRHLPGLSEAEGQRASDVLSRLIISYMLDPVDEPVEQFADWFVDLLLFGVLGDPLGREMADSGSHAP
jgi:AcrR family transcriptional regulator